MFREMRRKRQMLGKEECEEILNRGTSGVLALLGDEHILTQFRSAMFMKTENYIFILPGPDINWMRSESIPRHPSA